MIKVYQKVAQRKLQEAERARESFSGQSAYYAGLVAKCKQKPRKMLFNTYSRESAALAKAYAKVAELWRKQVSA